MEFRSGNERVQTLIFTTSPAITYTKPMLYASVCC